MDYECSDSRCGFDCSKVTDMHEARAGKMDDIIGKAKDLVSNDNEKILSIFCRVHSLEKL